MTIPKDEAQNDPSLQASSPWDASLKQKLLNCRTLGIPERECPIRNMESVKIDSFSGFVSDLMTPGISVQSTFEDCSIITCQTTGVAESRAERPRIRNLMISRYPREVGARVSVTV